jgi:hypothetical protein
LAYAYAAPLIFHAAVNNTNLVQDIIMTATVVDRIKDLLTGGLDNFAFDFVANVKKMGTGNSFAFCNYGMQLTSIGG